QALRGTQPPPQERAVPLGDVDAELPHQSRRQGPVALAAQGARGRERGAQDTLRKETIPCPKNAHSSARAEKRDKVSPPAPSPANSSARRSRTSARENTAPARPSRRSPSACRRRAAPACRSPARASAPASARAPRARAARRASRYGIRSRHARVA